MSSMYKVESTIKFYIKKCKPLYSLILWLKAKTGSRDKVIARLQQDGLKTAEMIQKALLEEGIHCGLSSGTLLGVIREGHILKHDDDLDFMVRLDPDFSWRILQSSLEGIGCQLLHYFEYGGDVIEQTYKAENGIVFDVFGQAPLEDGKMVRSYYFAQKADQIYESRQDCSVWHMDIPNFNKMIFVKAENFELLVPDNAEEFLVTNYGPTWRVPDTGWNQKDALTEEKGALAKRYVC